MKNNKSNINTNININILTIFPEMFSPLKESMLGRAECNGLLSINIVDIREFSKDKHRKTDDYPFGGGQGMVFTPQPAFDALKSVGAEQTRNIYMSPRGRVLDADLIKELANYLMKTEPSRKETGEKSPEIGRKETGENPLEISQEYAYSGGIVDAERRVGLTVFCGHYEGIDQRIIDSWNMEEVSIGDYVLTGGELPAMVLVDAVARLIPGVLGEENSAMDESIYSGLLEYPQYTQPRSFSVISSTTEKRMNLDNQIVYGKSKSAFKGKSKGLQSSSESASGAVTTSLDVPEVLLSGNHKAIELWRFEKSLELTGKRRPDLLKTFLKKHRELNKDELKVLIKVLNKKETALLEKHLSEKETKAFRKITQNMNFSQKR